MKKVLVKVFSVLLIVASLLGLACSGMSLKSILDSKDWWEEAGRASTEMLDMLEDGVNQLKANEAKYVEGVSTFEEGSKVYEEGQEALRAGGAKLDPSQRMFGEKSQELADAHAMYDEKMGQFREAQKALEAGKAELAAGEKMLADNKQAYEEGKATLAKVMPIYNLCMKHYNAYEAKKAEYEQALADGDNIKAGALKIQVDMMYDTYVRSLGGMSMESIVAQVQEGQAQIAEYEAGMAKVEAGRKDIAAAEIAIAEAEQALAAAKNALDSNDKKLAAAGAELQEGIATYEKGKAALVSGELALAEGRAQLDMYEDGQRQVADGLQQAYETEPSKYADGTPICPSIADRLGDGFTFWKLDENGDVLVLDGEPFVDLDKALLVVQAGRETSNDTGPIVTHEIVGRGISTAFLLIASILGLVAGFMGFGKKVKGAGILAVVTAIFALIGIIVAVAFGGFSYPLSKECDPAVFFPAIAIVGLFVLLSFAVLAAVFDIIGAEKAEAKEEVKEEAKDEAKAETSAEAKSEALALAQIELEKVKAEAEIAKAEAEKAKAELELLKLKADREASLV